MTLLNDVQSRLNATEMLDVLRPASPAEVAAAVGASTQRGVSLCPAGALHSMGGQQFAEDGISINSSSLRRIGPLDAESGTVWTQAGVRWPDLVRWLLESQRDSGSPLSIIQKQTGADDLSLGGAVSSNIHGRVLGRRPIVDDIESFYLTTASGDRLLCSRDENPELFSLAIGGYGMLGFMDSVNLRLRRRTKLVRRVNEVALDDVIPTLEQRTREGAEFGDFQYMTDEASPDFMAKGIVSTYAPAERDAEPAPDQIGLSAEDWLGLYVLAHTDKARAYTEYAGHYLRTDGQVYWSDYSQFSPYLPEAGDVLYRRMGWDTFASLVLTELYVPRRSFVDFMESAKNQLMSTGANVVYGTVRLIEPENETALPWAREDYACIIFNLLVEHSPSELDRSRGRFQALIDCALTLGGCYYLTYHRWARKDQIESAYPGFRRFMELKDRYDPNTVFDSDWYRFHRAMLE